MNSILESTLADQGFDVTTAFDAEEAIEKCVKSSFDLLVTDVRLPGVDGVEVVQKLKELQPWLKSIVITGYASEDTPVRAIRLNIDDYLFKPFSLKYFLRSVDRVLHQEEERKSKRALFGKLFSRFGLSMGDDKKDEFLEKLVHDRQEAFQGLFVGIRSNYLNRKKAGEIYTKLDSLEARFRNMLNARKPDSSKLESLTNAYVDIHDRLALAEIGATEDEDAGERLPPEVFQPLHEAVKKGDITFEELLYAPLLRKTPDARFETLQELLVLKHKLWPTSEGVQTVDS